MNHTIVGICGPKRSGKDSSAHVLCRDYQFTSRSFASFLKEACQAIFMLSHEQLHGDQKEVLDPRWNVTPRTILQRVGTDLFRHQLQEAIPELTLGDDKTLWCRCMRLWIQNLPTPQRIVIPDVRFQDEEALVRSLGGIILRIHRAETSLSDSHVSETEQALIQADLTLENNGTLHELEEQMTIVAALVLSQARHAASRSIDHASTPEEKESSHTQPHA